MPAIKHLVMLAATIGLMLPGAVRAHQSADAQKAAAPAASQPGGVPPRPPVTQSPPDAKKPSSQSAGASAASSTSDAWALLMQGFTSGKFRDRSDAISALTILDQDRRAISALSDALNDKEYAIRVLAVTSLGDIKARSAIPQLRDTMYNDKSPEVSFAAAQALWKMGDRSGRDVFYEVLDGERKVKPNLIKSKMQEARMEMHDPKALALIGVNEASGAFLGPFSMGVSMVEEYAKSSGTSTQALCAQMLAMDDSRDTVNELTYALDDKNWTVRAAAAKSLAKLGVRPALPQLKDMMVNDKSQPARFAAAAAVIRLSVRGPRGSVDASKPAASSNRRAEQASPKTEETQSN
jgi:HEAT repeat protein